MQNRMRQSVPVDTHEPRLTPLTVLTIAGSDSGGGAGVQADLKTFAALGAYGTSAITAVTAQNTVGVVDIETMPVRFVGQQVRAVTQDFKVAATKTGMLATGEIVEAVADLASSGLLPNLVVDPVMVASSGDRLLSTRAERLYLDRLFRFARVITPNRLEAEVLCGRPVETLSDMHAAAEYLSAHTDGAVVIKGGHVDHDSTLVFDVVHSGTDRFELSAPLVETTNLHGTGCSFAAAVAVRLAFGDTPVDACVAAKSYVTEGIAAAQRWRLGAGHGPIDHFAGRLVPDEASGEG